MYEHPAHVIRGFLTGAATLTVAATILSAVPAQTRPPQAPSKTPAAAAAQAGNDRRYLVGDVGTVALVQYYADGFDKLTAKERLLLYYLAEAGIAGDPIYYDEISPYGLELKQLLEGIWTHSKGIDAGTMARIRDFTQNVWIYHGNYDLDSTRKFLPGFTPTELRVVAQQALKNGANFGVKDAKGLDALLSRLQKPIFDANYRPVLTSKSPPADEDIITASGSNLYEHVTLSEVEKLQQKYGLNSRVVKRAGKVFEEVWRAGTPDGKVPPGRYAIYLRRVIGNLEKAAEVADPSQADVLRKLIRYYQTGQKSDWYAYNIAWVKLAGTVDAINGFIEQYLDPRSEKGAFESVVSFVDAEQTKLMRDFAANAQYFESRAPWRESSRSKTFTRRWPTWSLWSAKRATPGPSAPSESTCPMNRTYGSSTAARACCCSIYRVRLRRRWAKRPSTNSPRPTSRKNGRRSTANAPAA